MPVKAINNYTFYKIVCLDNSCDLCYVGSTANFNKRKNCHKNACTYDTKKYDIKLYNTIRANGGWDNFKMIEIGKAEQLTKREAEQIEEEYRIQLKANMNTNKCYLTEEQQSNYNKLYYDSNSDIIKNRAKTYYQNNSDKIIEYQKQYLINNREKVQECKKKYRQANRDKILEHKKQYHIDNRDKLLEKKKERIICECGAETDKSHLSRHRQTKLHIQIMNDLVQK